MLGQGIVVCLALVCLGESVSTSPAFLIRSPASSDELSQALTSLVSGPLSGGELLLVTDNVTDDLIDLDQLLHAVGRPLDTPILLATQRSLFHPPRPSHHTQGAHLTALLLFYWDPTEFLHLLKDESAWNPGYFVLLCLNPYLNTTVLLAHTAVQRSRFILLLQQEVQADGKRLYVYTSLPLQLSPRGRPLTRAPLGSWNLSKFQTRQSLFPPRFLDFGGKVMNLSMWCADEPLVYVSGDSCDGQNVDALRIIGNKYNFGFVIKDGTTDGQWGSSENGKWTGMFRDLEREGRDLVINSQPIYQDRINAFDYTYPYTILAYGFMLRVPPPVPQWKNILYPFPTLMWGMLAATTIFVSSVLTFLLHRLQHIRDPINFILKVSGSLVLQAMKDREVRGVWWARVWLVVWWVAVVILSAAYTGNLVAVLTVPVFPKFIYTVQDLALADVRMLMLDYGSSIPSYLRTSNNPTLAALGTKLDINPITNPTDLYKQSIVDVMTGRHALIVFGDYIDYLRAKHGVMAYTYVVKERIFGAALSWFLPRHTPYTTTISDALMQLTETGVMDKLYQIHRSNVITPNTQIRGEGVINLGHMQGAFILLGLGAVVAFFTLIQELII